MSVIVSHRKPSRYEAVTYVAELRKCITELLERNLGIRDLDNIIRAPYSHGKDVIEECVTKRELLHSIKRNILAITSDIHGNVRKAYSRFPVSIHEYEIRRDLQNEAISSCDNLKKEFQWAVEKLDVDINVYKTATNAIDHEIELIKKWRQEDNKIKSYLQKG